MQPAKKLHPGIVALIVVVLVGIAATAVIVITTSSAEKKNEAAYEPTTTSSTDTSSTTDTTNYKDGTYRATGSYSSPGGVQSIDLTVTLEKGIITSTSIVPKATDGDAKEYQSDFVAAYKSYVVGRSVSKVSLSRVAGSSLTSNGFNRALDQIKSDAKS